jgi:hypothetical protein
MKNVHLLIPLLVAFASGCASQDPGSGDASGPDESAVAQQALLHRLEVGGESIEFSQFTSEDGQTIVMVREEGPSNQYPLVNALLDAHGELTTLEMFRALAGKGAVAHAALVASHDEEALAMGREETSVREIAFDVNRAVRKISASACDAAAYPYPGTLDWHWTDKGKRDNVDGFTYTCLKNDCGYMTTRQTTSRICNDSNTTIQERNAWDFDLASPWNTTPWADLPVNTSVGWFMPAGTSRRYSADGNSAAGKKYHARSGALKYEPIIK